MTTQLITPDLVAVDVHAADKNAVIDLLSQRLFAAGRVTDAAAFAQDVRDREAKTATGMPGGIGLPHAKSDHVTAPSLAVAKVPGGVDFGAPDGPATLVFLIAAPAAGDGQHLKILAALARKLVNAEFKDSLRAAEDGATVAHIVNEAVAP